MFELWIFDQWYWLIFQKKSYSWVDQQSKWVVTIALHSPCLVLFRNQCCIYNMDQSICSIHIRFNCLGFLPIRGLDVDAISWDLHSQCLLWQVQSAGSDHSTSKLPYTWWKVSDHDLASNNVSNLTPLKEVFFALEIKVRLAKCQ